MARMGVGRIILVVLVVLTLSVWWIGVARATIGGSQSSYPRTDQTTFTIHVTVGPNGAFAFALDSNYFSPGSQVTFKITQASTTPHTFTLNSVANFSFPLADSTPDLLAYFSIHHPLVNVTIPGNQGWTNSTTLTAPSVVGVYEFVCLQPGHFGAGMWGKLGNGVNISTGGGGTTGPGAPVLIIAGTITGLVVLALVLGFVVGRRRSKEEMPPERLGYAEPTERPPSQPLPPQGKGP